MKPPFADRCEFSNRSFGYSEPNIWVFQKGEKIVFVSDGCKELYRQQTKATLLGSVQAMNHIARLSPFIIQQHNMVFDKDEEIPVPVKPTINRNQPITRQYFTRPPAQRGVGIPGRP